jgi:hypothetical protein
MLPFSQLLMNPSLLADFSLFSLSSKAAIFLNTISTQPRRLKMMMRTFARDSLTRCLQAVILMILLVSLSGCLRWSEVSTVTTDWGTHKITFVERDCQPVDRCSGTFVSENDRDFRYDGRKFQMSLRKEELVVNGKSYGVLKAGDSVTIDGGKVFVNSKKVGKVAICDAACRQAGGKVGEDHPCNLAHRKV